MEITNQLSSPAFRPFIGNLSLVMTSLFAACGLSQETPLQDRELEGSSEQQAINVQTLLKRFDADANGRLESIERAAFVDFVRRSNARWPQPQFARPQWEGMIRAFDQNGDGHLQSEERVAAQAAIRAVAGRSVRNDVTRSELIRNVDVNGNGVLEPEEKQAIRQRIEEMQRDVASDDSVQRPVTSLEHGSLTRASLLRRFDLDQDGELDEAERISARRSLAEGRIAPRQDRQ